MIKEEGKILIVDDNRSVLNSLKLFLEDEFKYVETTTNPNTLPSLLQKGNIDVVLLDMNFSAGRNTGNEGLFWLKEILKYDATVSVVLITAYGNIELAIKAIKEGAVDFVIKPWDNKMLLSTLQTALKLRRSTLEVKDLKYKQKQLNRNLNEKYNVFRSNSPKMLEIYDTLGKISKTDVNVLILGENGSGKEIIAREIHSMSMRNDEAYISVDLGAIGESLFESELFGHKKGAYTDAKEDRMGRIEIASGGTLFLDEIGNVPVSLQVKLLTLLQNREVIPLGSNTPVPIDIRLVCATNMNLNEMVNEKLFREDLLYRINTIQIEIPPLRERKEDIPPLTDYFLKQFSDKYLKSGLKINSDAYAKLEEYQWPGNIRELKHTVEKAVILSDSKLLKPENFYFNVKAKEKYLLKERVTLEESEKLVISRALKNNNGNISHTARELNIRRQTLYAKIQKYGL
ncbi:sigma-54-dependent transcriptional regulator [Bacteroidota bacterium]